VCFYTVCLNEALEIVVVREAIEPYLAEALKLFFFNETISICIKLL